MIGLAFEHASWFPWVAAGLALTLLALGGARRSEARRMRVLVGRSAPSGAASLARDGLLFGALVAIALAALGPRLGERHVAVARGGADVVLLFDLSASMRAQDVPPSRLDRARALAVDLLGELPDADRVALAGVAGRGVLFTPLTLDHAALAEMIGGLDTRLIQPGGSNLQAGIAVALEAFEVDGARPRQIVLLSDGEQNHETDLDAAVLAARAQARVVSVAIGGDAGAPIPDSGAVLHDDTGRPVRSHRQTRLLTRFAEWTDGALLLTDAWGELPAGRLLAEVARDPFALREPDAGAAATPGATPPTRMRRVRGAAPLPFVAVACALLVAELWLGARRSGAPLRARRPSALLASALVWLALLAAAPDDEPLRWLERGQRAAEAGDFASARDAFARAGRDPAPPRLAAIAEHNLGVLAAHDDKLHAARDHFAAAIGWHARAAAACQTEQADAGACRYDDEDRRRAGESAANLAWTRGRLEQAPAPSEAGPPPADREATDAPRTGPQVPATPAASSGPESERTPLSQAERQTWASRVEDDARAALKRTAHLAPGERRLRGGEARW